MMWNKNLRESNFSSNLITRSVPYHPDNDPRNLKVLLTTHPWFRFYKCYFDFTYQLCIAPFRFQQQDSGEFKLVTSTSQKIKCAFLQLVSLFYIRTTFIAGWDYVQLGTDQISYFDLMFLVLLYIFDITTKSALWIHKNAFLEVFEELQGSPLLRLKSKWTCRRANILVYCICCTYLIPSVFYIALVLGVNPSDVQGLAEGIKTHTEACFNLSPEWEKSQFFIIFEMAATFITIYTSAFWHFSDVMVLVSTIFFHRLSSDFFEAIQRGDIADTDILPYYDSYKIINKKFNNAAGYVTCVFLTYPLSYYATHLVDMLNNSDVMNRFSMCIYLGNLSLTLFLGARIHLKGKILERWLRKNTVVPMLQQQLSLILFELKNEGIGIKGFFTITKEFGGEVVNLLLTLTIITIQFRMSTA
ncbi:unnamed protein product [Allacma fusca]|uniref:Uncharacterized protein n=1 Tax=Allacma fusca TaxID=39272 RepID=A0A8J2LLW7_9HEXA|nr:unnamed protein product [Allacma fusca]